MRASDTNWLADVTKAQQKAKLPEFGPGDQVRIWTRIMERDRVRLTPFEGLVIRRRGSGISESLTVRRVTHGEGVERIFPLHAPVLERIEVLRRGRVRRARLYYLRTKIGKTRIAAADQLAVGAKPAGDARQPEPERAEPKPEQQEANAA
ncbi:MAG: 50S ribosomal protein L19 [Candidatus Omnitrophica bacterium]|nr:50S ribosomal protein L19 [Candidatus Omnitrophota bacterium]